MRDDLLSKVDSIEQDNLIARVFPRAQTMGIKIAALDAEATVKRGTLLAANGDGTYSAYAGSVGEAKFSGNGTTTKFTVTAKPKSISGVKVGDTAATVVAYNAYTGEVELSAAPAAGTDNVVVSYSISGAGSTPGAILADDVVVGTSDAATAVAYRSGNFNPAALVLPEGYTLTEADKDALRHYDIIFTQML